MKTYQYLSILAAGGALAVFVTAASAQMIIDPGLSRWVPPSADITVHRSTDASADTKQASSRSEARPVSQDGGHSKAEKLGANPPTAAAVLVNRGN
jgi:hypothetical protein